MEVLYLGAILLLRVAQNVSGKSCSNLMPTGKSDNLRYISLRMGISSLGALFLLLISKGAINSIASLPPLGWIISAGTGVMLCVSVFCSLHAMQSASIILCTIFNATGLLIPTVSGIFLYNQPVKIGQWLGIALMLSSTLLLANSSSKTNGKITFKTVLLLLGCMISNGSVMLLQTMFVTFVPNGNVSLYSFLQFVLPCVALFIPAKIMGTKQKTEKERFAPRLYVFTVIAALAVFGISQISTVASRIIPVAILFPISDGGNTIVSALVAAIMFKERFTLKSVIGLALGVIGLVMVKLLT